MLQHPRKRCELLLSSLNNLPDDIKDTQFFGKVQELKNINL